VDGVYTHEFFGPAETDIGFSKRLRAVAQDLLLQFTECMRDEGNEKEIIEGTPSRSSPTDSKQISRSDYTNHVRELMRRTRGCELPGTFSPLIVGDLFYQQSRPWKRLVELSGERILNAIRITLRLILVHTTDETTREGLQREIIDPAVERYSKQLDVKIQEIIRPHQEGHPITYNHYFTQIIQKARQEHAKKDQARRLNAFFKIRPEMGSSCLVHITDSTPGTSSMR